MFRHSAVASLAANERYAEVDRGITEPSKVHRHGNSPNTRDDGTIPSVLECRLLLSRIIIGELGHRVSGSPFSICARSHEGVFWKRSTIPRLCMCCSYRLLFVVTPRAPRMCNKIESHSLHRDKRAVHCRHYTSTS